MSGRAGRGERRGLRLIRLPSARPPAPAPPTPRGRAGAGERGEAARFLAGGTDLIIQINRGRTAPRHLISLAGLGLDTIGETPGEYMIGAMATHDAVVTYPGFQNHLVALTEASAVIGGRQVRNVATVGGNIDRK